VKPVDSVQIHHRHTYESADKPEPTIFGRPFLLQLQVVLATLVVIVNNWQEAKYEIT
jgi:hypothetical protein